MRCESLSFGNQKHPRGVGELTKIQYDVGLYLTDLQENKLSNPIVDFSEFSFDDAIADQAKVYEVNPHRFELALLDGVLFLDETRIVGYHNVPDEPFWARGHFPGRPMMPGVLISEVAAQLTSYLATERDVRQNLEIGLAGLEKIRFRYRVMPGDQLVVMCKMIKSRAGAIIVTEYQAYVGQTLASEGQIKGVAMKK